MWGRRRRGAEIVVGAEFRRSRRRRARGRRRSGTPRIVAAEFAERVGLSDQSGKFGERIATGSRCGGRRTSHQRFIRTIGLLGLVVRHSVPDCLSAPPPLAREPASNAVRRMRITSLSSGASTPRRNLAPKSFWTILDNAAVNEASLSPRTTRASRQARHSVPRTDRQGTRSPRSEDRPAFNDSHTALSDGFQQRFKTFIEGGAPLAQRVSIPVY